MMKFEKSWSIGNAVTLIVIVGSIFTQYGISSQEVVVIKKDIEILERMVGNEKGVSNK